MINKKNLWFLTLFSLVLVLSIYYVTMPNEVFDKDLSNKESETTSTEIKESSVVASLKVEDDTTVKEKINSLKEKIYVMQKKYDKQASGSRRTVRP